MSVLGIPFNRPPRVQTALPQEEVEIPTPPAPPTPTPINWLAMLLPLAGMLAMAGIYIVISPNVLFAIPMLVMGGFSVVASLLGNRTQRRAQQKAAAEKEQQYQAILTRKRSLLSQLREQQQAYYHDVHPPLSVLLQRAGARDPRLWERRPEHQDFLCLRFGQGRLRSTVKIRPPQSDWPLPHLEEALALAQEFQDVPGVPISVDLRGHGPIGVAGRLEKRVALVRSLLCHLVTHHAPDEVHLLAIYSPERGHEWQWLKWLPHTYALGYHGARRYLANDSKSAEELLSDLLDELHQRQNRLHAQQQQQGTAQAAFPWIVLLVEDYAMVRELRGNTAINLILSEGPSLNATGIFLVERSPDVPDGCRAIVEIQQDGQVRYAKAGTPEKDSPYPQVMMAQPEYADLSDCEKLARALAPLQAESFGGEGALPSSIRLLDLLDAGPLDSFDPDEHWNQDKPEEDLLRVPIGAKRGGQPLYLDLKHTAHGPHGLVGGTTGSGKSELLQTIVAGLALTHHPHEVGFVLVDFKGGGAFSVLRDLPHTLGLVTDLGGGLAERALVALNSELKRRELILEQAGVNDIRHYRPRPQDQPMPRLIIIIDEFAELARSFPDFMAQLIGVAQKGRSLGVHLILATQRPSGAVNPNIWSNAKFRICLRVETRDDSNDMLHRPEAAYLPRDLPGRGYLQVGSDEVFELFQVARVAGRYQKKGTTQRVEQNIQIAEISPLGKRTVLVDTGRTERSESRATMRTEAEVIVEVLQEAARRKGLQKLPSPWPEPLPASIPLPALLEGMGCALWTARLHQAAPGGGRCAKCGTDLADLPPEAAFCPLCGQPRQPASEAAPFELPWPAVVLGKIDDPANQRQDPFVLPLGDQDGHLRVVGAPGSGLDMVLRTIVYSLAQVYSPDELHLYLIEFAGAALTPFRALPHCGGFFGPSDEEPIRRLFLRLADELERRQALLHEAGADNLVHYRQGHPEQAPPAIVVPISGFAAFHAMIENRNEYAQFQRLLREGGAGGIHMVLSGNRPGDIPTRLASLVARCLTLKLADPNDYAMTIGQVPAAVRSKGETPLGRGWYGQPPLEFQAAAPVQAAEESAQLQTLQREVQRMNALWSGPRPAPIEVLPETVPLEPLLARLAAERPAAPGQLSVPLGLDDLYLRPVAMDLLQDGPHFLVAAPPRGGKTTALLTWALGLAYLYPPDQVQLVLLGLRRASLSPLAALPHVRHHCASVPQLQDVLKQLVAEVGERQKSATATPHIVVMVDDYGYLATSLREDFESKKALESMIRHGRDAGVGFVVAGRPDELMGDQLQVLREIKAGQSGLLLKQVETVTNPLNVQFPQREFSGEQPAGRGFLVRAGTRTLVQVATPEGGKGIGPWIEEIRERWAKAGGTS